MKPVHWFLLLALALAVAPKLAAVWVQRGLEVEDLKLDLIDCGLALKTSFITNDACMDDMRFVIWREQERKKRKTRRK